MAVVESDLTARFPFLALLRRELVAQLRTRRLFFGLLLLSIICAWVVVGQWPFGSDFNWSALVYRSESLFTTFTMLALTGGPIIVAAIAGGTIVGERERESWDLLQLSLISRLGVIGGKLLNPFALFLLTLAVCAPIFAALLFLSGLDYFRAGQCLLLIAATSITCGAIAIACSVRAGKTVTAITLAFFFVALFMGMDAVAIGVSIEFFDEVFDFQIVQFSAEEVFILSPYYILANLLESGEPVWPLLLLHLGLQLFVAVPSLSYSVWALGRGELATGEARKPRRGRRTRVTNHSPLGVSIPDRSNPIFRRELYWGSPFTTVRARRLALVAVVFCFLVSSALAYTGSSSSAWDARILIMAISSTLIGAAACLYVPVICANAYTKELAISNFDMLRGTLLRPADIVLGKFKAALALCAAVTAGCFIANLPVNLWYLSDIRGWYAIVITYGSLLVSLVQAASAGLFASFYSKRSGAAIVATYALVFTLFFGIFLIGSLLTGALPWETRNEVLALLATTSPVISYFGALIRVVDENELEWMLGWASSLPIALLISAFSQYWMIRRFHGRMEKLADQ